MTTPDYQFDYRQETAVSYQPTEDQRQRAESLRRFNRLYLYLPIGFATFIAILLIGLMLWFTFAPGQEAFRSFTSGLADVIIILTAVPLTLLCSLPAIIALAIFFNNRQKPKREFPRTQVFMWKVDSLISRAQSKTDEVAPRVAEPVIKFHGLLAYINYWRQVITNLFTRS